jgi:hypothetical protein
VDDSDRCHSQQVYRFGDEIIPENAIEKEPKFDRYSGREPKYGVSISERVLVSI